MRLHFRILVILLILALAVSATTVTVFSAPIGQFATETLQPSATLGGPTVFAADQVNVRSGPGTFYEQVGVLIAGQSAPAIGRSSASEWIQIEYPGGPGGKAWVYSPLVSLQAGTVDALPVIEAPATATLAPTPTTEGAVASAGTLEPTRLPTFTARAAIVQPTFQAVDLGGGGFPPAVLIIGLFMIGVFAGAVALLRQRA